MEIREQIWDISKELEQDIIHFRRELHQYPELAFQEHKTAQLICQALRQVDGVRVYENVANSTAVLAVLEGKEAGPTRAIRAAIDGFSIQEETGLTFSSKNEGCMHATGHDALAAINIGVAHTLSKLRDSLKGKIVFLFQPAEEGGGGAKYLLEHDLLKNFNIDIFFGCHTSHDYPAGKIALKENVLTTQSDRVWLEIVGKGAHAAKPEIAIDPVVISAQLILAYQEIISREISPFDFATLSFGEVKIGSTYNAIPEKALLRGSIRTYSPKIQDYIEKRMREIFQGITSSFRATGKMEYYRFYPSVINHPELTRKVFRWAEDIFGQERIIQLERPSRIAEDFAFYCQKRPSCFAFIGNGGDFDVHSSHFVIDESIFLNSIRLFSTLLLNINEGF